jgi:glycosyltransferase involved in cell wall biosynthesis
MIKSNVKTIYINGRFLTQNITGVQRYAHEIIKALDHLIEDQKIDDLDYQFILLSPQKSLIHSLALKNIEWRQVGKKTGHAWEQLDLPQYIKDGLLFCPGNTAPVSILKSKMKTVITVHDLSYLYFPRAYSISFKLWYRFLIPLIMRNANAIITVSESEKRSILKYYPYVKNRLFAIQNGGLPEEQNSLIRVATNSRHKATILYVGSLSRRKNFQGVIKALEIVNTHFDICLVVVGIGGLSFRSPDFHISQSLQNKVIFKGQINNFDELISFYKKSTCLVFPSFYEASPLPPIEAMACGCPVIVSNIPALQERCSDAALYCNPDDPQNIADKIIQLLKNGELRESIVRMGLLQAKKYGWEKSAWQTFSIMEKILENNSS